MKLFVKNFRTHVWLVPRVDSEVLPLPQCQVEQSTWLYDSCTGSCCHHPATTARPPHPSHILHQRQLPWCQEATVRGRLQVHCGEHQEHARPLLQVMWHVDILYILLTCYTSDQLANKIHCSHVNSYINNFWMFANFKALINIFGGSDRSLFFYCMIYL